MSGSSNGRIPESFIQSVINKTDIVSLIQESFKLKKAGANYSACCPFHHEKTPSFTVSPSKQFFHCFGCGKHGDAIAFMMEHQALSFVEAVEKLAVRLGMEVPKDPAEVTKIQIKLHATSVLKQVAEFYAAQLKTHSAAGPAIDYLKRRGLTGKTAKNYALGFAPPGWDNLLTYFKDQPEALKILEETGLIIRHPEGRYYDRFRQRIMFPIRDRKGEVIGFGGRVLDNTQPKYLNSPESSVFQKGQCLYGIYESLKTKTKWQTAVVVEGYFDVVMLAQYEIFGVFATLGTAISTHHLTTLFHLVPEITFCFDGDTAGQAAAWKALQLVLPLLTEGRQVKFAFLPKGDDPDSYVRTHGTQNLQSLLQNSMPLSEYFFRSLTEKVSPTSVDNRAHLASIAKPMIEQMPAGIFKEMMFEELAKLVATSTFVVRGERAPRFFVPYSKGEKKLTKATPPPQPLAPAIVASAILLIQPTSFSLIKDKTAYWQALKIEGINLLAHIFTLLSEAENMAAETLLEQLCVRGFTSLHLSECIQKVAYMPEAGREAELTGAFARLMALGQQQIMEALLTKSKTSNLTEEEKRQLKEILQMRESIS